MPALRGRREGDYSESVKSQYSNRPARRTRSPTRTRTEVLNEAADMTQVWNSPRSPQGS